MEQRAGEVEALMPQLSEQDWIIYRDRWQMYDEQNAGNWVLTKYGQKSTAGN